MRHLSLPTLPTLPFLTLALLLISAQGSPSYAEGRDEEYAQWEQQENAKNQAIIDANNRTKAEKEREKAIEYAYGGKADQSARRDEDVGDIAGKYGMGEQAEIPQNADADKFLNSGTPKGYVDNNGNYVCTTEYMIGCQEEQNQLKHACSGYGSRDEREKCHMRLSFEREQSYNEYMYVKREAHTPQEHQAGSRADQDSEINRALNNLGYNATQEEVDNVHKWYDQGGYYNQAEKQKTAAIAEEMKARRAQSDANNKAYKAQKQYEAAVASGDQTAIADATAKRDATRQARENATAQTKAAQEKTFEKIYDNRQVNAVGPANRSAEYYADANGKDGRNEPLGRREQTQRDYEKAVENELNAAAAQQDARAGLAKAQSELDKAQAHEKATSKSLSDEARSQAAAKTQAAQARYDAAMQTMATRSQQAYQARAQLSVAAYGQMAETKAAKAEQAQKDLEKAKEDLAAAEEKETEARAAHEAAKASGSKAQEAKAAAALAAAKEETNLAKFDMLSAQTQSEKAGYEAAVSATDAKAAQMGLSTGQYADLMEKEDKISAKQKGSYDPAVAAKEALAEDIANEVSGQKSSDPAADFGQENGTTDPKGEVGL